MTRTSGVRQIAAATTLAVALAACATHPSAVEQLDAQNAAIRATLPLPNADYGQYPSNYKDLILAAVLATLKDPDSAKSGGFTQPQKDAIVHGGNMQVITPIHGYSACVTVNSKNSYGAYTGPARYWVFIRNNEVLRIEPEYGLVYIGKRATCIG